MNENTPEKRGVTIRPDALEQSLGALRQRKAPPLDVTTPVSERMPVVDRSAAGIARKKTKPKRTGSRANQFDSNGKRSKRRRRKKKN